MIESQDDLLIQFLILVSHVFWFTFAAKLIVCVQLLIMPLVIVFSIVFVLNYS